MIGHGDLRFRHAAEQANGQDRDPDEEQARRKPPQIEPEMP